MAFLSGLKRLGRGAGRGTVKAVEFPVKGTVRLTERAEGAIMGKIVAGLVRHAMTAAGGALAAHGLIMGSDTDAVVGALVTLVGALWSVYAKKHHLEDSGNNYPY